MFLRQSFPKLHGPPMDMPGFQKKPQHQQDTKTQNARRLKHVLLL